MRQRLYPDDPLSPDERDEYERDLISFCDQELDLLGDIRGKHVLYAGGTSPLWIEGLAERTGPSGSLTVLDLDRDALERVRDFFGPDDLPLVPDFIAGDVFDPLPDDSFDLVYSSGLFHELDVRRSTALAALGAMSASLRTGGMICTSDFVDDVDAVQIRDEYLEAVAARRTSGEVRYGISCHERLVELHRQVLSGVRWEVRPPFAIRHLDRLFLASGPPAYTTPDEWGELAGRIEREGYTRPATLFVTGTRR